jgi:DNA repair exonuclease SbcCD ATPase subunit
MKLKKLEVNSFGGIHPSSPIIIDFTQSKWIVADGDNGVGKTSLLNALLVACGQLSHTGEKGKNFINNDTNKIDINFSFVGNDRCNYEVRCTKSSFQLTYDGNSVAEPITKMKELLGVVGISPMSIKNKPLNEIVKWLANYSTKGAEEIEKEFDKLKRGIKQYGDARATANKSYKALKEYLEAEPLFNDWEGSEIKYKKEPDIKELSAQLKSAGDKSDKYIQGETKLTGHKARAKQIEEQILSLQKELQEVNTNIRVGEEWLEKNKSAKKDYDDVKKKYDSAAEDVVGFNKWVAVKAKKTEMDDYETLSQQADASEKDLKQQVKELQAEILPDIKGIELITEDITEGGVLKKEGLYYENKNVAQLSETEWYSIVMMIWKKLKVKIVIVDNMQSLGTKGIEWLEKLNNDGAYILAAEMNRESKTLEIKYE